MKNQKEQFILNEVNDLSFTYNEDKIVVLPKDPNIIFLYWDFSDLTFQKIIQNNFIFVIRLYNHNSSNYHYITPSHNNRDWYYNLKYTDLDRENLIAELGYFNKEGYFVSIVSSLKTNFFDKQQQQSENISFNHVGSSGNISFNHVGSDEFIIKK